MSQDVPDQFYRLFTSLCLHAGILHLAITVAFQHIFLSDLERLLGPLRTAVVYIGSGIAGNLTSAILVPYRPEVSCQILEVCNLLTRFFEGWSIGFVCRSNFITVSVINFLSLEAT